MRDPKIPDKPSGLEESLLIVELSTRFSGENILAFLLAGICLYMSKSLIPNSRSKSHQFFLPRQVSQIKLVK